MFGSVILPCISLLLDISADVTFSAAIKVKTKPVVISEAVSLAFCGWRGGMALVMH